MVIYVPQLDIFRLLWRLKPPTLHTDCENCNCANVTKQTAERTLNSSHILERHLTSRGGFKQCGVQRCYIGGVQ